MSAKLVIMKTGEPWTGQRLHADGSPCECVRHPPNIGELWTDQELAAIGLARVIEPPAEEKESA